MLSCIVCCLYFDAELCLNLVSELIFISFSKLLSVCLQRSGIKFCSYVLTGPDKAGVNVIGLNQLHTLVCHSANDNFLQQSLHK